MPKSFHFLTYAPWNKGQTFIQEVASFICVDKRHPLDLRAPHIQNVLRPVWKLSNTAPPIKLVRKNPCFANLCDSKVLNLSKKIEGGDPKSMKELYCSKVDIVNNHLEGFIVVAKFFRKVA